MPELNFVSGFIYHKGTGNILLKQTKDNGDGNGHLELFCGTCQGSDSPEAVFHRYIQKMLDISVPRESIIAVYDYEHDSKGVNYIYYAEIDGIKPDAENSSNASWTWLPLAKLSKFPMDEQTRHDIVIGSRVIRANELSKSQSDAADSNPQT